MWKFPPRHTPPRAPTRTREDLRDMGESFRRAAGMTEGYGPMGPDGVVRGGLPALGFQVGRQLAPRGLGHRAELHAAVVQEAGPPRLAFCPANRLGPDDATVHGEHPLAEGHADVTATPGTQADGMFHARAAQAQIQNVDVMAPHY